MWSRFVTENRRQRLKSPVIVASDRKYPISEPASWMPAEQRIGAN